MPLNKNRILLFLGYFLAMMGISFKIYSITPSITNYPFPIAWSESGRIFAAYQVYAPIITGKYLSFPWLDAGRSILDGMVFLIPNSTISTYRLWVNILLISLIFLAAFFTIRKAFVYSRISENQKKGLLLLITLWGLLFLMQGPVYYHVIAGVIPILWLYDNKRSARNLIVIILCSLWEGLCRVNWFLMPAIVAVLLHMLRTAVIKKKYWNYIQWPLIYSISGGIISFTINWIHMKATGYESVFLNPKMNYFFFRYKLWPNSGFIGLIPGIILISFPVLLVLLFMIWKYRRNLHWIRLMIFLSILGIFFVGSTVVSLRAGGGFNLHNYDTFLLLIFIAGCFFGMDAVWLDQAAQQEKPLLLNYGFLVLLLVVPMLMAIPKPIINEPQANPQSEQSLQEILRVLQTADGTNTNHPILFIDQRQLLAFHIVEDENIFIPYEKIELMEMAMANNWDYRSRFVNDLENHKFPLIVSEILGNWQKSFSPDLFERDWYENNIWVDFVSIPILDHYSPIYIDKDIGVAIYAPLK